MSSEELQAGQIEWKEPDKQKQAAGGTLAGFGLAFAVTSMIPGLGALESMGTFGLVAVATGVALLIGVAVFLIAGR